MEGVVEELDALDVAVVADRATVVVGDGRPVVEVEQHSQVEHPLLQARHVLVRLAVGEAHLDAGAARAKDLDRLGAERHRRCRKRSEADPSAGPAGDCLELRLRLAELREDRFGVGDERLAGLGQAHAAGRALEQVHAGVARQCGHLLGHRRRREAHRIRRRREAAAARDLREHRQPPEIQERGGRQAPDDMWGGWHRRRARPDATRDAIRSRPVSRSRE